MQSDHTLSYKYLGWPRYDFGVTVIINSIVIFIIIRNVAAFVTLCFPSTLVDVITVFIVIVKYFTKSCLQKVLASYFSCFHSFLLVWSMRLVIISIFSFFNFFFDGSECMRVFLVFVKFNHNHIQGFQLSCQNICKSLPVVLAKCLFSRSSRFSMLDFSNLP